MRGYTVDCKQVYVRNKRYNKDIISIYGLSSSKQVLPNSEHLESSARLRLLQIIAYMMDSTSGMIMRLNCSVAGTTG